MRLLEQSWNAATFNGTELQFAVYRTLDFKAPMDAGVSVFIYRVMVNGTQRTLPPGLPHHRHPLPTEVHLLLTAWARDASLEHDILGWAMRTVEDNPILTSGFLNATVPGVFRPAETVELVPGLLSNDEVFRLWEVLPNSLQLSAPDLARVIRIESELVAPDAGPVITRELDYGLAVPS
ncbi:MAG: hypothetical protein NVSMB32_00140 [Actinomycetota bacterium]